MNYSNSAINHRNSAADSYKPRWGRRIAIGIGGSVLTLLGANHLADKHETPTVPAVVQQGDSPQSLVDRYNDETVNVPKLADEMLEQSNVQDGLIPSEEVRVPVQSPKNPNG